MFVFIVLNVKFFYNKFFKYDIIFKCKVWLNLNLIKCYYEMNVYLYGKEWNVSLEFVEKKCVIWRE